MPLDFTRAAQLFMGTEEELAESIGVSVADLRSMRTNPRTASPAILARLGKVLIERGRGMARVGEMLEEDNACFGSSLSAGQTARPTPVAARDEVGLACIGSRPLRYAGVWTGRGGLRRRVRRGGG
jgi:hypothetical protein